MTNHRHFTSAINSLTHHLYKKINQKQKSKRLCKKLYVQSHIKKIKNNNNKKIKNKIKRTRTRTRVVFRSWCKQKNCIPLWCYTRKKLYSLADTITTTIGQNIIILCQGAFNLTFSTNKDINNFHSLKPFNQIQASQPACHP